MTDIFDLIFIFSTHNLKYDYNPLLLLHLVNGLNMDLFLWFRPVWSSEVL